MCAIMSANAWAHFFSKKPKGDRWCFRSLLRYYKKMAKEIIVSGVRPTGNLHIGNYLGAIKQFVELQKKYKTYFFVADLHAINEPQDPEKLEEQTLEIVALYLACGLEPASTTLFLQSHI